MPRPAHSAALVTANFRRPCWDGKNNVRTSRRSSLIAKTIRPGGVSKQGDHTILGQDALNFQRSSGRHPSRCSAVNPETILPHSGRRLAGTLALHCPSQRLAGTPALQSSRLRAFARETAEQCFYTHHCDHWVVAIREVDPRLSTRDLRPAPKNTPQKPLCPLCLCVKLNWIAGFARILAFRFSGMSFCGTCST